MNEKNIHQLFVVSLFLKGLHALLECAGGIALALVDKAEIVALVNILTQGELTEDPHDLVATHLQDFASGFSISSRHFYSFYLLSHGLIKVFLIAGLLRNRLWAYPLSLAVLGLFIAYQVYRYFNTHAGGLIFLTFFDLIVILLIWHEYRLLTRSRLSL